MRRQDWKPTQYSRLCSVHFEERYLDKTSKNSNRLRENAVPTIFPGFPSYYQNRSRVRPISKHVLRDASSKSNSNTPSAIEDKSPSASDVIVRLKRQINQLLAKNLLLRRKVKLLQQNRRRAKSRIDNMKSIISDLSGNRWVPEDNVELLSSLGESAKALLTRQICKSNGKVAKQYSPELRKFALTLNFLSPKAYDHIRNQFNTCLPHRRTISKWYECVEGSPGFTKEAFEALTRLQLSSLHKPVCSLMIDEMSIRKFVEWDGKQYHGYVDFGANLDGDYEQEATNVLVFMLVCVNGGWKLPLGYFLVVSLNAEQKKQLILTCIDLIEATNTKVVSLTFDGASSNLAMYKLFGCTTDLKKLHSNFILNNSSISVFWDPCHMVKLIRNTLGEKKVLIDMNGNEINWRYIEQLNDIQESEGLHLGNKLRSSHVNFFKQKMKVKLATQTLSKSVADAIDFCASALKLPQFRNCEGTINFIKLMNTAFDILNSRTITAPSWKKAVCQSNVDDIKQFIDEIIIYLSELRFPDGQKVIYSNRKTGFLGIAICLNSLKDMYDDVVGKQNLLKYLPMYKFSQDHVELFFSAIRSHGGSNNNPTARQFQAAYKRLLIRCELRDNGVGNCIPLEQIPVLNCASARYAPKVPEDLINTSTDNFRYLNVVSEAALLDHDYELQNISLTECTKEIIVYIAGFVVRYLQNKLKCEKCIGSLVGSRENFQHSLIFYKSFGGLVYPARDVVCICNKSEQIFRRKIKESSNCMANFNILQVTNEVMSNLNMRLLFTELNEHMLENSALENHLVLMTKSIILKYLNIRLSYYGKHISQQTNPVRNMYTKLILFKGQ